MALLRYITWHHRSLEESSEQCELTSDEVKVK